MWRCYRQDYCNAKCARTGRWAPRSNRTLYVERLGRSPTLTTRQIGAMVGLSFGRVASILRRHRRTCVDVAQ